MDASKCLHPYDSFKSFDENDLKILYNHYADDFKGHDDLNLIKTDHTHYKNMLLEEFNEKELKKMTLSKLNKWIHQKNKYPLIAKLLKLVIVIPSSTATCERTFSALSFIKNKRRNKLGVEYLDDLMLSFLEKDLVNKILCNDILMERVVDVFKDLGNGTIGDNKSRKNYL